MRTLRLKIADLLEVEGQPSTTPVPDVTALTPLVLRQYGFLPQPLMITVEGDEVVLDSRMRHRPAADHGSGSACDSGALG